nr:putative ribonuclease H-like domain-containing protein [Tanacetum cinerariifolium]
INGVGWDWSYMENDEENHALVTDKEAPIEFALMAKTSAESKVFDNSLCSKDSKKNTDSLNTSKDLDSLLESQRLDNNKEGLGYSVVPPPPAQIYPSPKKDMSWTGLPEFKDDTVTDYNRPAPTVECSLNNAQNINPSVTETEASPTTISPKSFIKFVKENDSITNNKTDKAVTAKKPSVKHNQVRGLPTKCFENDHTCTTCLKGKQHKASCLHGLSFSKLRMRLVAFLGSSLLNREPKGPKVKIIMCDNGREFRNKEMNDFCSLKGIKREFSNARTPQQNGVAERRNRTLIEAARTMLADAKLLVTFWAEVVNTTSYVQNRVLVNKSQNKTPYELFNGRTPAIGFLKPFGYHVMILNTLDNLGKFEAKGDEGYFIGYSMSSKAFRVFNNRTRRVEENLHVEFLENKAIEKGVGQNWLFDIDSLTKSMNYVPVDASTNSTNLSGTNDASSQEVKKDVSSLRYIALPHWVHDALLKSSSSKPQDDCSINVPKSSRNSNPTATLTNPPGDQLETLTVETPIPTVSSPIITTCLNDSLEPSSDTRLVSKRIANQVETPSLDNILTLTNRFEDILRVTTNLVDSDGVEANTLVNCPKEVRPIETKWVLKNKKDERGIVIRNKARLVAQGHTQEKGIDYDEVFAPVARIEAIRLFLAYASFMGFTIYQMDVKSAFLYGTIDEEVYVMQPPGFQDPECPAKMYNVEKAMYGLHQAPRAWYGTMSKYLLTNGFQRGTIDHTLFIIRQRGDFILVQVYVDDIIFGSSNPQLCREFEALMHEKFQLSAMGELNFFLGLQVLQKEDGIFLSQDKQLWPLQQLRQNMLQLPVAVDKFCGFIISCLIMGTTL